MEETFYEIHRFINSWKRNQWIMTDVMKIYIRKSKRMIEGNMIDCIDLASMEVIEEENRSKGIFTEFLKRFIETYPEHTIFVESILSERFALFFEKFELKRTKEDTALQRNMYLLKRK